jgi:hypothetical protein
MGKEQRERNKNEEMRVEYRERMGERVKGRSVK